MKHKIQQNQINGLPEALSQISTEGFLKTSGGPISDLLTINGDVQVETIVGNSLYMDRINLGGEQSYGSVAINGTGQKLSARLILDSNAATNKPTSYANLIVDSGISFTLNSSNNYPIEGAEIGQMTIATSGAEAIISTEASEFKISESEMRTNKPIEISNIRIENKFLYLDRRSGLLDQIDPEDYIGADYTLFANTENIGANSSFLQKYSLTYSRRLERDGICGVIKDQIGITGSPIEIVPVKNGGIIDVYLRNNCFENWRVYALCEKLKHEGFSSASSSISSSSSSVSSSSSRSSSSSSRSSSSSNSSSSSRSSCSSRSSETFPNNLCVRGAGVENVNGVYTRQEAGTYLNENGAVIWLDDNVWAIDYNSESLYYSEIWDVPYGIVWTSSDAENDPPPQVLYGECSSSGSSSSSYSSSSSTMPDPECVEPDYYSFATLPTMWTDDVESRCADLDETWCLSTQVGDLYESPQSSPPYSTFLNGSVGYFGPGDVETASAYIISYDDIFGWILEAWAFNPHSTNGDEYYTLASFGGTEQTGPYGEGSSTNGYYYILSWQDPDSYIEITDCEVQLASGIYENAGYGSNGTISYKNENDYEILFSGTMYCGGKWILTNPSSKMMAFWNDPMTDYPEGLVAEAFTVSKNTFATVGNSGAE